MDRKNMQLIVILIVVAIAIAVVLGFFGIGSFSFFPKQNVTAGKTPAEQLLSRVQQSGGVSELMAEDITAGTGDAIVPGDTLSVAYTGALPNGTIFDSTQAHGGTPLPLVVAADGSLHTPDGQGLIPGWSQGMAGMKEGGRRLLAIPPTLGYGAQDIKDGTGKVLIPANSTLIFDLQLVKVTHAGAAATSTAKIAPATTSAPRAQ